VCRNGVMAGLVPAIHAFLAQAGKKDLDACDKRWHDAYFLTGSFRGDDRAFDSIRTKSAIARAPRFTQQAASCDSNSDEITNIDRATPKGSCVTVG
jgi:hypothetical protein